MLSIVTIQAMLLPHVGFICKSNSYETIERLTLSNNIKQMKRTGQFVTHHEFLKWRVKTKEHGALLWA